MSPGMTHQTMNHYRSSMSAPDSQMAHHSDQVPRWRGSRPVAEPAASGGAPAVAAIPYMQGGEAGTAEQHVVQAVPETASPSASRAPISPPGISPASTAANAGLHPATSGAVGNAASDADAAAAAAAAAAPPRIEAVSTAPRTVLHKTSTGICEVHL